MPVRDDVLLCNACDCHTGIKVNSLAIGAWQWGDKSFWGYDTFGDYGDEQIRYSATVIE